MLKLLFLMSSFLGLYQANVENPNYHEIIQEVVDVDKEICFQEGIYEVYKENGNFHLRTNDLSWIRNLPNLINYKIIMDEQNCLIFYQVDGKLNLLIYNSLGDIVINKIIIDNKIDATYDVIIKDDIYIIGSVKEYTNEIFINKFKEKTLGNTDGFIVKLNDNYEIENLELYGGVFDDSFQKGFFVDDYLYIVGQKDPLSDGDFGNGGRLNDSIIVIKINMNLEIVKYQILNSNAHVLMFSNFKDYLYLSSTDNLYKFDNELNIINKITYPSKVYFSSTTYFNKIISISHDTGYLFNIYNFEQDYSFTNSKIIEAKEILKFEKIFYVKTDVKNYYFDIASLENFIILDKIYDNIETPNYIVTAFGNGNFVKEESEPLYNPLIYGTYQRFFTYENLFGIDFTISKNFEIPLEVNVSDGGIYSLGYKLKFTGNGYLNGENILNNYEIVEEGRYVLDLYGNDGNFVEYTFNVEREQLRFEQQSNNSWDLEVNKSDVYFLNFSFVNNDQFTFDSVIINGEEYKNLIIDREKNKISIKMIAEDVCGIYNYYIESLNYFIGEDLRSEKINKVITVNVINEKPNVEIVQVDDLSIKVNVIDPGITLRYFQIKAVTNTNEVIERYSLTNQNIVLHNLKANEQYHIYLTLVYDLGDLELRELELINETASGITDFDFGDIDIIQKSESLNNFNITLTSSSQLEKVMSNQKVIYDNNGVNILPSVVVGIISLLIVGVISFYAKIYVLKKRNKI